MEGSSKGNGKMVNTNNLVLHFHRFEKYDDHGPEDYGDPLAEWCPGCGRLRSDIEVPPEVVPDRSALVDLRESLRAALDAHLIYLGDASLDEIVGALRLPDRSALVEALRPLSDAATPGEWFWNSYSAIFAADPGAPVDEDGEPEYPRVVPLPRPTHGDVTTKQGGHDARLIVAAVNYVRAVLSGIPDRGEPPDPYAERRIGLRHCQPPHGSLDDLLFGDAVIEEVRALRASAVQPSPPETER